uniref:J domain-containing protein n=1 Tax=Macrostomum lignano TaxID=282301 RepID=A0A1I8FQZ8_9PLAT
RKPGKVKLQAIGHRLGTCQQQLESPPCCAPASWWMRIYLQQTHEQVTLQLQLEAYQREVTTSSVGCTPRRPTDIGGESATPGEAAGGSGGSAEGAKMPNPLQQSSSASQSELEPFSAPVSRSDPAGTSSCGQLEAQLAEQRRSTPSCKENRQLLSRVSSSGSGVPRMFQRFTGAAKSGASAASWGRRRLDWRPRSTRSGPNCRCGWRAGAAGNASERRAAELAGKMAEMRLSSWSDGAERLETVRRIEEMRLTCDQAGRLQRESTECESGRREPAGDPGQGESALGWRAVSLQFASQQLRLVVDQWLDRVQGAVEELRATLQVIVDEIGKYKLRARAVWTGAAVHRERATRPGFDERLFSGDGGSKSSEQKKPSEQAKPKPQMQLKPVAAPSARQPVRCGPNRRRSRGQADAPGLGGGGSGQPRRCRRPLLLTVNRRSSHLRAGEAATSHSRVTGSPAAAVPVPEQTQQLGRHQAVAVQQPRAAGVSSDAAEAASISTPLSAGSSITLMTQWHSLGRASWPQRCSTRQRARAHAPHLNAVAVLQQQHAVLVPGDLRLGVPVHNAGDGDFVVHLGLQVFADVAGEAWRERDGRDGAGAGRCGRVELQI